MPATSFRRLQPQPQEKCSQQLREQAAPLLARILEILDRTNEILVQPRRNALSHTLIGAHRHLPLSVTGIRADSSFPTPYCPLWRCYANAKTAVRRSYPELSDQRRIDSSV